MSSVQSPRPGSALAETRREFARWRADRGRRRKTPDVLRRRAIALLEHHCAFHVCRALGINATALTRWAAEARVGDSAAGAVAEVGSFVALEAEPSSSGRVAAVVPTPALTVELPLGIRVHCDSARTVVELLEACELTASMRNYPLAVV